VTYGLRAYMSGFYHAGIQEVEGPMLNKRLITTFIALVMLAAGWLYTAYGGQAYPFMALLSAAGLAGILCLARASGRRVLG